jgi:hypothetical protein
MTTTAIIDLIATRLPDDGASCPDWAVRCTWADADDCGADNFTFHAGTDECGARSLARFILDRYQNPDTRNLKKAEIRRPDGTWETVPRPMCRVPAPVYFAFQRLPHRPR